MMAKAKSNTNNKKNVYARQQKLAQKEEVESWALKLFQWRENKKQKIVKKGVLWLIPVTIPDITGILALIFIHGSFMCGSLRSRSLWDNTGNPIWSVCIHYPIGILRELHWYTSYKGSYRILTLTYFYTIVVWFYTAIVSIITAESNDGGSFSQSKIKLTIQRRTNLISTLSTLA